MVCSAASRSASLSVPSLPVSSSAMPVMSFILPLESRTSRPYASMASAAWSVGADRRCSIVFRLVPASEPFTPWSANRASAAAVSSRLHPASDAWALHWLMACVRSDTSAEDALAAPASALAMRVASPAPRPKLPIICTVVSAASARLSWPMTSRMAVWADRSTAFG